MSGMSQAVINSPTFNVNPKHNYSVPVDKTANGAGVDSIDTKEGTDLCWG